MAEECNCQPEPPSEGATGADEESQEFAALFEFAAIVGAADLLADYQRAVANLQQLVVATSAPEVVLAWARAELERQLGGISPGQPEASRELFPGE